MMLAPVDQILQMRPHLPHLNVTKKGTHQALTEPTLCEQFRAPLGYGLQFWHVPYMCLCHVRVLCVYCECVCVCVSQRMTLVPWSRKKRKQRH